jgi:NitT/TauT family transport system ATP-binding protein
MISAARGEPDLLVRLSGVTKVFSRGGSETRYSAVRDVDLTIAGGEFFCLLGPSGCGKSTLLHMVAGFERPTRGTIVVNGRPVVRPDASRGVVFQGDSALFPWLTAEENVLFGLKATGVPGKERQQRATDYLRLVGLYEHRHKYPRELSGGMRQRIQLARILANQPQLLLMDEPFAALDAQTRRMMQGELERIWTHDRRTVLFITHDIEEATRLGDRIGIMNQGPGAGIVDTIAVRLPRPRTNEMTEFVTLLRQVEQRFEEIASTTRVPA